MYRDGKRILTIDKVKFRLRRGGPDNNFLMVTPDEEERRTPVLNFAYDERVEDRRTSLKVEKRSAEKPAYRPQPKRLNFRDKKKSGGAE